MKTRLGLLLFSLQLLTSASVIAQSVEWAQHFNAGVQKVKTSFFSEAAKEFETCISLDRNQTEAYKNLAYCYVKLSNFDGAVKAYQDFLNVSPNDVEVMKALAALLLKSKKYALGYDILKKLTLFAPSETEPLVNLGLVCDYLGKSDEALECYLKAIRLRPGDANLAFNIGRLYFLKGEFESAISYFKAVLDRSPGDYDAAVNIANAYMSLGEKEFKHVKSLKEQGYVDETRLMEENRTVRGYYERALPYLLVAAKSGKPSYMVLNNLGITLKNLGRAREANRVLEIAVAAKNNQPIDLEFLSAIPLQTSEALYTSQRVQPGMAESGMPPLLTSDVKFAEPSGNNALDAEETGTITIKVKNIGKGPAPFVHIELEPEKEYPHLIFERQRQLPGITAGDSAEVIMTVSADLDVQNMNIKLKVKALEEQSGNDADPFNLSFETRAVRPPQLALAEFGIDDDSDGESFGNDNGRIEKGELIELTAIVINRGIGKAEEVVAQINPPGGQYFNFQGNTSFDLGDMDPGASRKIKFAFSAGKRYEKNAIEFGLAITERRSRFNTIDKIAIPLEERQMLARDLVVKGVEEISPQVAADKYEPTLAVDVDMDIPQAQKVNEYGVAVIIGNKNYQNPQVSRVDFAQHDAQVVKEYVERALGYLPGNILSRTDATQGEFNSLFGDATNYQGRLFNIIKEGQSDVFIYYSGHGAPDPEGKKSYFLPVDCDPSLVRLNGYSLDVFYNNLSKLPAKSITVVIDACFSGATEQGFLIKQVSPVYIEIENPILDSDKIAVFSSSSGKQVSTWYPEKRHGLFTYFFLKGLRGEADLDSNKVITAKELAKFTNENVSYMARYMKNLVQTPEFTGANDEIIIRQY